MTERPVPEHRPPDPAPATTGNQAPRAFCRARLALAVIALVLALAPAVTGLALSTPQERFQGFTYNYLDSLLYQAWARQARDGSLLATLPYGELEPATRVTVLFPLLLGWTARVTGLELGHAQVLLQALLAVAFLAVLCRFLAWWMQDEAASTFAFGVLSIGSGLGWFLGALPGSGGRPLDLYDDSQILSFSMATFPHHILCAGLYVGAVWALMAALEGQGRYRQALTGGMLVLANGLVHPYHYPELFLLAGVLCAWRAWSARSAAPLLCGVLFVGPAVPHLAWTVYSFATDGFLSAYKSGVVTTTPPWKDVASGFGIWFFLLPFCAVSAARFPERLRSALVWIGVLLLLTSGLVPLSTSKASLNLFTVPLVAAGVYWLMRLGLPAAESPPGGAARRRRLVLALAAALCLPSSLLICVSQLRALQTRPFPFFVPAAWLDGLAALEAAPPGGLVMASFPTSLLLAVHSRVVPVLGHPNWTPDYKARLAATDLFFSKASPEARQSVLTRLGVTAVVADPLLARATGYRPDSDPLVVKQFDNGTISLARPK